MTKQADDVARALCDEFCRDAEEPEVRRFKECDMVCAMCRRMADRVVKLQDAPAP